VYILEKVVSEELEFREDYNEYTPDDGQELVKGFKKYFPQSLKDFKE
jgi:hypothetical protein